MGKSPGKWIKTVLFGKKSSKSNLSKNVTPDKKSGANTAVEDPSGISSVISDPPQYTDRGVEDIELENGSSDTHQGVDSQYNNGLVLLSGDDMRRQEEAVTKAQAAFRGYLARRAFRALKGIIRLQALIRGHLVRRQAVATLHCMQAIVKFQALARGQKVRLSDAMSEVRKTYNIKEPQDSKLVNVGAKSILRSEKLAANSFVRKLLVSLPTAMPLSLQYDLAEPNSAWNWLERWSLSRFWVSPTRAKKTLNAKSQKKPGSQQAVETDSGKSKRTIRKAATTTNGDNGSLASLETDKPKRNQRKITNHPIESVQEQPQNELERVKRSLRKVSASASAAAASEKPETENEKPQSHTSGKRVSASAAAASEKLETEIEKPELHTSVEKVYEFAEPEVSEQKTVISSDNGTDSEAIVDKQALPETQTITTAIDEAIDVPHYNHPVVEISSSENGEKTDTPTLHDESSMKEEDSGKENQKMRKRRSLPAKQEYPENISQNTPSIPSYMAATQSAKAKLRAQGSGKFGEDGAENGFVRRHSLPALANGKMSALSPRIQKPVQANGKGGNKTNRLLTTSRDDKALQPGWRR